MKINQALPVRFEAHRSRKLLASMEIVYLAARCTLVPLLWFGLCCSAMAAPTFPQEQSIQIFGQTLTLGSDCIMKRRIGNQETTLVVELRNKQNCHFVWLPNTDVPHLEWYQDAWLVLVESSVPAEQQATVAPLRCDTEYKVLIVRNGGEPIISGLSNGGVGCAPFERDRGEFTALAAPYFPALPSSAKIRKSVKHKEKTTR